LNNLEYYFSLNEEKSGERAAIDTYGNVATWKQVRSLEIDFQFPGNSNKSSARILFRRFY
jgi:hypothetical protein